MYPWEEPEDGELAGIVSDIFKAQKELTGIVKELTQAITDIEARLNAIERPRFEDVKTILN